MKSWLPVSVAVLFLTSTATAQNVPEKARGLDAAPQYFSSEIDNLNLFNGNLTLRIPVGQGYPVGGPLTYQLQLMYNSNLWETVELWKDPMGPNPPGFYTQQRPNRRSNAGMGWMLTLGRIIIANDGTYGNAGSTVYESPDGTNYSFFCGGPEVAGAVCHPTADTPYSGMRLRYLANGYELDTADGLTREFNTAGRLTRIRDQFRSPDTGEYLHYLDVSYTFITGTTDESSWTLTDSVGRTHTIWFANYVYDNDSSRPFVTKVELTAFGGKKLVYDFTYVSSDIDRPYDNAWAYELQVCKSTDTDLAAVATVAFLTKVTISEKVGNITTAIAAYDTPYHYYVGNAAAPCNCGALSRIDLPTKGSIEWDYGSDYEYPRDDEMWWAARNTGVVARRLITGSAQVPTWTYSAALVKREPNNTRSGEEQTTTVTYPDQTKTEHLFSVFLWDMLPNTAPIYSWPTYGFAGTPAITDSDGRLLNSRKLDGAGALRSSEYIRYSTEAGAASEVSTRRTVYNDNACGGNCYTMTESSGWDNAGHFKTTVQSGNFPGTSGATRTVFRNYLGRPADTNPRWIPENYDAETVTENGVTATTNYCFDADTGFLKAKRTQRGANAAATDLLTRYSWSYDLTTDTETIIEKYFGGDAPPAGAYPSGSVRYSQSLAATVLCGATSEPVTPVYAIRRKAQYGAALSVEYDGAGYKLLDHTVDRSSGLASSSRDTSGVETTFSFDALSRIKSVAQSGRATTEYTHVAATGSSPAQYARVELLEKDPATPAVVTASKRHFDPLGRRVKDETLGTDGATWHARETTYDSMGRTASVSELGNTAAKTTYLSHDSFGRATAIRPPDSTGTRDVTINYFNGIKKISRTSKVNDDQTSSTTTEEYDHFGRLYRVTDPHGMLTEYSYDVGGRLKQACVHRVNSTCTSGGQLRTFSYDRSGLLSSEEHPESGTTSYSHYDPRGRSALVNAAGTALTNIHDSAERLVEIRNAAGATLKRFTFGTPPLANGRLATAERFNYGRFTNPVRVTENYAYGPSGDLITRETAVDSISTSGAVLQTYGSFVQAFESDLLGERLTTSYPRATVVAWGDLGGQRNVMRTAHANNLPNALTGKGNFATFLDVPPSNIFYQFVEIIRSLGITAGCGGGRYCPASTTLYKQMAIFILRSKHGGSYQPPPATGIFVDVATDFYTPWIEALYNQGIVKDDDLSQRCSQAAGRSFCPDASVTRAEMAPMLLRAKLGGSYTPPQATGVFSDVSPTTPFDYRPWIEDLYNRRIVSGCSNTSLAYCPTSFVTRGEMSVMLVRTFGLALAPPPSQPTFVSSTSYHSNGMLNTVTMPSGVSLTQTVDASGIARPARRYTSGAVMNWDSSTYAYDGSGNVRSIGDDSFVYDGLSRLQSATVSGQATSYTYDLYGNRLTASGEASVKVNSETNRLCTNSTAPGCAGAVSPYPSYDARGNLLTYSGDTYTYDEVGMMSTLGGGTTKNWKYFYTADDERIWAVNTNGTTHNAFWTVRDTNSKVLREFTETGNFDAAGAYTTGHSFAFGKDYLYHLGSLAATFEPGGTTRYYFSDHLGTPRLITNGTNGERHNYHPYGREITAAGSVSGRLRFTEHERDSNGGSGSPSSADLDYMHARYYSPVLGRFLSVDPVLNQKRALTTPQSWNRYSYVENNPMKFVDPTGRYTCQASKDACGAIERAIKQIETAAGNLTGKERERLLSVLKFYGKPGEKNGVFVRMNVQDKSVKGGGVFSAGVVSVVSIKSPSVRFPGASFTVELGARLAHEGDHGVNPDHARSPQEQIEREMSAYFSQALVNKGSRVVSDYGVWTPGGGINLQKIEEYANESMQLWCEGNPRCGQ